MTAGRRLARIAAALVAATTLGAGIAAAASLSFRSVARGDGGSSSLTSPAVDTITSAREWRRTWARLRRESPRPRLPRIDFARHTLVLVTTGRRTTGGHSVRVTAIDERARRLVVTAVQREPGPSCVVTQALTAPWHVVRVRRTRKPATVVRRRAIADC